MFCGKSMGKVALTKIINRFAPMITDRALETSAGYSWLWIQTSSDNSI